MNMCVGPALSECRRECTAERIPQTAKLFELDAREPFRRTDRGQEQHPLDVLEVDTREHAPGRPALHRAHRLPNGRLANRPVPKAPEVENAVLIIGEQEPRDRVGGLPGPDIHTISNIQPNPKRRLQRVKLGRAIGALERPRQRHENPRSDVLERGATNQAEPRCFGTVHELAGHAPDRAGREPSRKRERHPPKNARSEREGA